MRENPIDGLICQPNAWLPPAHRLRHDFFRSTIERGDEFVAEAFAADPLA
jgi:hypothetical protein